VRQRFVPATLHGCLDWLTVFIAGGALFRVTDARASSELFFAPTTELEPG
jgi:hypothetical protein